MFLEHNSKYEYAMTMMKRCVDLLKSGFLPISFPLLEIKDKDLVANNFETQQKSA